MPKSRNDEFRKVEIEDVEFELVSQATLGSLKKNMINIFIF
jgi:hypothetical protein